VIFDVPALQRHHGRPWNRRLREESTGRKEGQAQESIEVGVAAMWQRWRAPDVEKSLEAERWTVKRKRNLMPQR
jgi:hypothetical protein